MNSFDWKRTSCVGFLFQLCLSVYVWKNLNHLYSAIQVNIAQSTTTSLNPAADSRSCAPNDTNRDVHVDNDANPFCLYRWILYMCSFSHNSSNDTSAPDQWLTWMDRPPISRSMRKATHYTVEHRHASKSVYRIPRIGESALNKGE